MSIIVPCPNCGMYLVKPVDRYCGYCGKPLAILIIDNGAVQVDLPMEQKDWYTHTLRVQNAGITDLSLTFDPSDASIIQVQGPLRFDLHPYDEAVEIAVQVNCGALAKKKSKVCSLPFVSTDPKRHSGKIYFCIPEPDKVVVDKPDSFNLGDIDLSVRQQLSICLTNTGGQAILLSITSDQDSPFRLAFRDKDTFWIPGYQQGVELPLDVWSVKEGLYKESHKLLCAPGGQQEGQYNITIRLIAKCAKGPIPVFEDIGFDRDQPIQVVPGQVKLFHFVIKNDGSVPFTINKVELDKPELIHILTNMPLKVSPGLSGSTIEVYLSTRKLDKVAGTISGQLILETDIERQPNIVIRWKVELFVPDLAPNLVLAVDFGTVNSCAAVYEGHTPEIVRDDKNHDGIVPSILVFVPCSDEVFLVGKDAEVKAPIYTKGVVRNLKRCFENEKWTIYDRKYTSVDLASLIIEQMILEAMRKYNKRPEHIAMAIPAAYSGFKREAMRKSCKQACERAFGVDMEPSIIDEPTAVAMHYLKLNHSEVVRQEDKSVHILVFDFGGGTLDISIVKVSLTSDKKLEICPIIARGDNFMGGIDIDVALLQGMVKEARETVPEMDVAAIINLKDKFERIYEKKEDAFPAFQASRWYWCEQSRLTKERLSEETSVKFQVDYLLDKEGKEIVRDKKRVRFENEVFLNRFEELIQDRVDRACEIVRQAVHQADLQMEDVQVVLMTGQSSKIKKFYDAIRKLFPWVRIPTEKECPLKTSVACGTAIVAHRLISNPSDIFVVKNLNRTSYRYGIELEQGINELKFVELVKARKLYTEAQGAHSFNMKQGFIAEAIQNGTLDDEYRKNHDKDISSVGRIDLRQFPLGETTIEMRFPNGQLMVKVNKEPIELGPAKSRKGVYI